MLNSARGLLIGQVASLLEQTVAAEREIGSVTRLLQGKELLMRSETDLTDVMWHNLGLKCLGPCPESPGWTGLSAAL